MSTRDEGRRGPSYLIPLHTLYLFECLQVLLLSVFSVLRLCLCPTLRPAEVMAMATKLSSVPIVVKHFHVRNFRFAQSILCSPTSAVYEVKNMVSIEARKLSCKWKVLNATGDSTSSISDEEDGVSLGTMKLPSNTDLPRFETLLFQWGNSLCQGANLPLPLPLKVDKIPGGARLGFITIDDGKTEILVYIDCLVFPATESSGPIFRAIRNGPSKAQAPPGEPRIMRSLLGALQKSVEITRL